MVAAEARASGMPVIVPDRGGASDHAVDPASLRYTAASGDSLRDAIVAFASRSPIAHRRQGEVRTMDDHFAELFALYRDLRTPLHRAA